MMHYAKVAIHATRYHCLRDDGIPMCGRPIKNMYIFNDTKTDVRPNEYAICVYCREAEDDTIDKQLPQMTRELYDALYDLQDLRFNAEMEGVKVENMRLFIETVLAVCEASGEAGVIVGQFRPANIDDIPF